MDWYCWGSVKPDCILLFTGKLVCCCSRGARPICLGGAKPGPEFAGRVNPLPGLEGAKNPPVGKLVDPNPNDCAGGKPCPTEAPKPSAAGIGSPPKPVCCFIGAPKPPPGCTAGCPPKEPAAPNTGRDWLNMGASRRRARPPGWLAAFAEAK